MRPFKLGLSKPKKKNDTNHTGKELSIKMNISEIEEINVSRDTIDSISSLHLKKAVKTEPHSYIEPSDGIKDGDDTSIAKLVDEISIKHNKPKPADLYDAQNNYIPAAGTSNIDLKNEIYVKKDLSINDSFASPDNKLGIMSFYDSSKLFDMSLENNGMHKEELHHGSDEDLTENIEVIDIKKESRENSKSFETNSSERDSSVVLTPRIRPPSKNYIMSTLEKYNIPKVKNSQPYYSDHKDVGDKVEIGQMILKLQSKLARDQKPLDKLSFATSIEEWRQLLFMQTNEMSDESSKPDSLKMLLAGNKNIILEPIKRAPTRIQVMDVLEKRNKSSTQVEKNIIPTNEISKNLDELENSQAIGLHEDEINNSVSLDTEVSFFFDRCAHVIISKR